MWHLSPNAITIIPVIRQNVQLQVSEAKFKQMFVRIVSDY